MAELPDYTLHLLSRITPQRRAELEALVPAGAKVVFHNGVTDDEYDGLLKRTTALVSLSRAEGYGLPLVEAMRPGHAGDCQRHSDLPRSGRRRRLLCRPGSPAAVRRGRARSRTTGTGRTFPALRGSRANEFSWDESARQLVDVAQDVVAIPAPSQGASTAEPAIRLEDVHAVQPELHRFLGPLGSTGGLGCAQDAVTAAAWP